MVIRSRSILTGKVNEMDLPVTPEQVGAYRGGALVQDAFPGLNATQREFIITGLLPTEQDTLFDFEEA